MVAVRSFRLVLSAKLYCIGHRVRMQDYVLITTVCPKIYFQNLKSVSNELTCTSYYVRVESSNKLRILQSIQGN